MTYEQIKKTYLADNPTHFDYLHAIRAAASRNEHPLHIYNLADEAMNMSQPKVNPNWKDAPFEMIYETNNNMNTPPNTIRVPDDKNKAFPCRGMRLDGDGTAPSNKYHPAQVSYLVAIKRYTGRMMADIGHLPAELRSL